MTIRNNNDFKILENLHLHRKQADHPYTTATQEFSQKSSSVIKKQLSTRKTQCTTKQSTVCMTSNHNNKAPLSRASYPGLPDAQCVVCPFLKVRILWNNLLPPLLHYKLKISSKAVVQIRLCSHHFMSSHVALCASVTCGNSYSRSCCCLVDRNSPCSADPTHTQQPHHARRVTGFSDTFAVPSESWKRHRTLSAARTVLTVFTKRNWSALRCCQKRDSRAHHRNCSWYLICELKRTASFLHPNR